MNRRLKICFWSTIVRRPRRFGVMGLIATALAGLALAATICAAPPDSEEGAASQPDQAVSYSRPGRCAICGAYALASALSASPFDLSVQTSDLVDDMLASLSEELQRSRTINGFTMGDLVSAAERRGVRAQGVRVARTSLHRLPAPAIVHVQLGNLQHYVAYLGSSGLDQVLIVDQGRELDVTISRLEEAWTGYAVILETTSR